MLFECINPDIVPQENSEEKSPTKESPETKVEERRVVRRESRSVELDTKNPVQDKKESKVIFLVFSPFSNSHFLYTYCVWFLIGLKQDLKTGQFCSVS